MGTNNIIDNNDKNQNSEDYNIFLDHTLENISSTSMIFITKIPDVEPKRGDVYSWFFNYRYSDDWLTTYCDDQAEKLVKTSLKFFNSDITSKANERKEKGQNIIAADVNSAITDMNTELKDGLHQNEMGYKVMEEYWCKFIDEDLNGN